MGGIIGGPCPKCGQQGFFNCCNEEIRGVIEPMTIPCTRRRIAVQKPCEVDQVSFVITEANLKNMIKEHIIRCGGVGRESHDIPESFDISHYNEDGDVDIYVTFDVPVVESK